MAYRLNAYTPAEDAWLLAHYATAPRETVLAAIPGRLWTAILQHAHKIGAARRSAFIPRMAVTSWHPANMALLRAHYPTQGPAVVAALTGLTPAAVRSQAHRCQVGYTGRPAPRPAPQPAVKRSLATPNLNGQKAARKRREEAPQRAAVITADAIRKLPYNHPGRMAYLHNGTAGWQQWQQQQPQS